MTDNSLQRLYENPATRLSSGTERAQIQAELLVQVISPFRRPLRVVDLGCGNGMSTEVAMARCALASQSKIAFVGIDWSVAALTQARRRGVTALRGSIERPGLGLASSCADVVIMSELIEHLVDPDLALSEARRVLAPGGTLLLSTPNLAAWYNRALLVLGVQPLFTEVSLEGIYGRPGHEVVGHLRVFTRRALMQLLAAHDFIDIAITGAPYHDVPRPFRPLDRFLCRVPSVASILLATARRPV